MNTSTPTAWRHRWRPIAAVLLAVALLAGPLAPARAVAACTDDAREEDDTYQTATDWGTGSSGAGVLCDEFDYVAVHAVAGDTITATLDQVAADGDLDISLGYADEFGEDTITTTIPDPAADQERIVHEVTWDDTYYVAVGSLDGATNEYTLTVSVAGAATVFDVDPDQDVVTGTGFPADELLTIEIDDPATVDDPDYGTPVVSEADGSFRLELAPDVVSGLLLRVLDNAGGALKDTTVAPVTLATVDTAGSTVSGAADPNADVEVLIVPAGTSDTLTVATTADGAGAWSADVSGTWNLRPGDEVRARQVDADGDGTLTPTQAAPGLADEDQAQATATKYQWVETTGGEPTADNPLVTRVQAAADGEVTISETDTATTPVDSWYQLLDLQVAISAPPAPAGGVMQLEFLIDESALPAGMQAFEFRLFRNGEVLGGCPADPCLYTPQHLDGYWRLSVNTSHASTWNVGVGTQQVDVDRLAGDDRIATAAAISKDTFDAATTVVLARADTYPDALAGAPLAAELGAPILLTDRDRLSDAAATEIQRLGAARAVLLGGAVALSTQVEADLAAIGVADVGRFAGTDRFDTARRVAAEVGGTSVYVTEGVNVDPTRGWPDAVAVSALAAYDQAPILLVSRDQLPAATAQAIEQLGVTDATIVGGNVAVSDAVAQAIDDLDVIVTRVRGEDRFETSTKVVERAVAAGMTPRRPWLATGSNYPDALVAGPAVAHDGGVLLLVDGQTLDRSTAGRDWLAGQASGFTRVVVVGGDAVVADTVVDQVAAQVAAARSAGS